MNRHCKNINNGEKLYQIDRFELLLGLVKTVCFTYLCWEDPTRIFHSEIPALVFFLNLASHAAGNIYCMRGDTNVM